MREKISVESNVFGKLLPHPYIAGSFFTVEHLSSISNCLKKSTFCQPRVHSIWPVLVNIILPDVVLEVDSTQSSHSGKKHKRNRKASLLEEEVEKNLKCFCEVVLEGFSSYRGLNKSR
ncbi:uncharacterized protein LOC124929879 [Impatiens glandulifera]|uniref:uncharacterized protein LOC124929879 n=1 Tax=Impatiens glandulifera TaxID=253017 RepID=UPI001FB15146|nr:uncharacterized protein LOC124929879 [Impatiens glandulifera]